MSTTRRSNISALGRSRLPLWDDKIARAARLGQPKPGKNSGRYLRLMDMVRKQCRCVGGETAVGRVPVKAIDEFNYCRNTRGWI